jgi:hypothetical protein
MIVWPHSRWRLQIRSFKEGTGAGEISKNSRRWVKFTDGAFSNFSGLGSDSIQCCIPNSPTKAPAVAGEILKPGF